MRDPLFIPQIVLHVGLPSLAEWLVHFSAMGAFTALHHLLGKSILDGSAFWMSSMEPAQAYKWRRLAEAWKFGAGLDYKLQLPAQEDTAVSSS